MPISNENGSCYEFSQFRLEVERRRLSHQGEPILLPPKAMDTLLALVERQGKVVEREELLRAVWGETIIEDANLTVAISTLRKVFGQYQREPLIETVPRLGYRFTTPIRQVSKTPLHARIPPRALAANVVGREKELASLRDGLALAHSGRGLLLCVTGEPGIGKTTLVENFLASLSAETAQIAHGRCAARLAGTEAYLPVLEMLTNFLTPQTALLMQEAAPAWYAQVAPQVSTTEATLGSMMVSQERLKRELRAFFHALTLVQPLVLFFDDLHWADVSTVDLLAYLAANFASLPVLIVVTYRTTELLLTKHPFALLKPDLQARGICRELSLEFLSGEEIATYLTREFSPHTFPPEFPSLLHAKTEGSPLFMVDLVRYLLDRGVIAKSENPPTWTLAITLPDIERDLPESVRGMIERKLAQLEPADYQLLTAASVQGAEFDSAVVAAALELAPDEVEERLARLERVNEFVRLLHEEEFPTQAVTLRYRFVHVLYQNALYDALQPTRRAGLSATVAQALLGFYGEQRGRLAAALANLLENARDYASAADYFLQAAGGAARLNAYRESVALARRGLYVLQKLPATPERDQRELSLQVALGLSSQVAENWAAPATNEAFTRAYFLCNRLGDNPRLFTALYGIWVYRMICGEYATAETLAAHLLQTANKTDDAPLLMAAHIAAGSTYYYQGKFRAARAQQETALTYHRAEHHPTYMAILSEDLGVTVRRDLSWGLWTLGYPDQALAQVHEGLALADHVAHPFSQSAGLYTLATLQLFRSEWQASSATVERMNVLVQQHDLGQMAFFSTSVYSIAIAHQGQLQEGIAGVRQFLTGMRASGFGMWTTGYLAHLAALYLLAGRIADGLALIGEALIVVDRTGEQHFAAELHRLKGELLLHTAALNEAEVYFQRAIAIAQQQNAKSWELRATTSLARLWQRQSKTAEARQMLAEIYGWFTEGFDTADLKEAKALLDELES